MQNQGTKPTHFTTPHDENRKKRVKMRDFNRWILPTLRCIKSLFFVEMWILNLRMKILFYILKDELILPRKKLYIELRYETFQYKAMHKFEMKFCGRNLL